METSLLDLFAGLASNSYLTKFALTRYEWDDFEPWANKASEILSRNYTLQDIKISLRNTLIEEPFVAIQNRNRFYKTQATADPNSAEPPKKKMKLDGDGN